MTHCIRPCDQLVPREVEHAIRNGIVGNSGFATFRQMLDLHGCSECREVFPRGQLRCVTHDDKERCRCFPCVINAGYELTESESSRMHNEVN